MSDTVDVFPGGATWVFQGTVAESATAGTHVCTLTVTPGAGNEMQVLYGRITVGNTATAQIARAEVTDGTNTLSSLFDQLSITAANTRVNFPAGSNIAPPINSDAIPSTGWLVSGAMTLTLTAQTVAVSVTQTFAVVCRIRGGIPTATLADTVDGGVVLTTNTSKVF